MGGTEVSVLGSPLAGGKELALGRRPDWDTVGLAPPERDLWMVASDTGEELRRYTNANGRPVDPAALALYRLRWALDDISIFVRQFRSAHRRTKDTEHAWLSLKNTLAHATRWPSPAPGVRARLGSAPGSAACDGGPDPWEWVCGPAVR
jgi:spectinomycin phosphotransferase